MDFAASIAEQRIREAERQGAFEQLPGKGKPLPPDELDAVPEELRLGYKLLKNAGALPPEMELRKEMVTLEDLIRCCSDEQDRGRMRAALTAKRLRYRLLMEERGWGRIGAAEEYRAQVETQLTESDPGAKRRPR
ncbi:DnaJ family domain-containing protein [Cohnella nanjingensis]|uniref:DUF1992 domain-containing protein n=1 Tax=Cohnella nanjingensis TaxID=1387779 RepID=A0A7X0RVR1_9BACL|nr:DUF1992 domain-containing protein [Cohnella nanjingensis]MBB6673366.1 DUF1992 domain-containing protein [Cohnella nanjingensis]